MYVAKLLLSAALLLSANLVYSQATTLGAILDQGAKKLNADEAKALIAGTTTTAQPGNATITTQYKADGSIDASFQGTALRSSGGGAWKVEPDGKYCGQVSWSNSQLKPFNACGYVFLVGDKTFVSASDSDRNAAANPREFKK
jgi:hypothetical protein